MGPGVVSLFSGIVTAAIIIGWKGWRATRRRAKKLLGQDGQAASASVTEMTVEEVVSYTTGRYHHDAVGGRRISNETPVMKTVYKISYQFRTANGHNVVVTKRGLTKSHYISLGQPEAGASLTVRYLYQDPRYCRLEACAVAEATEWGDGCSLKVRSAGACMAGLIAFLFIYLGPMGSCTWSNGQWRHWAATVTFDLPCFSFEWAFYVGPILLALGTVVFCGDRWDDFWPGLGEVTVDGDEDTSPQTALLTTADLESNMT